jgi:hypothetical protein
VAPFCCAYWDVQPDGGSVNPSFVEEPTFVIAAKAVAELAGVPDAVESDVTLIAVFAPPDENDPAGNSIRCALAPSIVCPDIVTVSVCVPAAAPARRQAVTP